MTIKNLFNPKPILPEAHEYNLDIAYAAVGDTLDNINHKPITPMQKEYLKSMQILEREYLDTINKKTHPSDFDDHTMPCDWGITVSKLPTDQRQFIFHVLGWIDQAGQPIYPGLYAEVNWGTAEINYYLSIDAMVELLYRYNSAAQILEVTLP